jgi:hypothetical protein
MAGEEELVKEGAKPPLKFSPPFKHIKKEFRR